MKSMKAFACSILFGFSCLMSPAIFCQGRLQDWQVASALAVEEDEYLPGLTIYVDFGVIGHVFIGLSGPDGGVEYWGYYPIRKSPIYLGELRDDLTHPYSMKKTFVIDKGKWKRAQKEISRWNNHPGIYSISNRHCGVFAEALMTACGLHPSELLPLVEMASMSSIPHVWYTYLRSLSGSIKESGHAGSQTDIDQIHSKTHKN